MYFPRMAGLDCQAYTERFDQATMSKGCKVMPISGTPWRARVVEREAAASTASDAGSPCRQGLGSI